MHGCADAWTVGRGGEKMKGWMTVDIGARMSIAEAEMSCLRHQGIVVKSCWTPGKDDDNASMTHLIDENVLDLEHAVSAGNLS